MNRSKNGFLLVSPISKNETSTDELTNKEVINMSIITHLVALCDEHHVTIDAEGRVWPNARCGVTTKPGTGVTTKPGTGVTIKPGTGVTTKPGTGVTVKPSNIIISVDICITIIRD